MTLMTRAQWFAHNRPVLSGYERDGEPDDELIRRMDAVAEYGEANGYLMPPARPIAGGLATDVPATALPAGYITPAELIRGFITAHEGGLSMRPSDTGNYFRGELIGSKFGVTGNALQAYREEKGGGPVTKASMAALTLDEAVDVGVWGYYQGHIIPGANFHLLDWNRVTMIGVDMAWGAGRWGARLLQRLVGAREDGQIGGATAAAFNGYIARVGEEEAARAFVAIRTKYHKALNRPEYERGWINRNNSFLPGTPWWKGAKR